MDNLDSNDLNKSLQNNDLRLQLPVYQKPQTLFFIS